MKNSRKCRGYDEVKRRRKNEELCRGIHTLIYIFVGQVVT
jgi:hypothetical protein